MLQEVDQWDTSLTIKTACTNLECVKAHGKEAICWISLGHPQIKKLVISDWRKKKPFELEQITLI